MNKSRVITVGSAAAVLALTAGTASAATTMITSHDIKDGTIRKVDLSPGINSALEKAPLPATAGTVYRVAHYSGGANGGAIATVSCADSESKSQKYVAISGGVQILNADGDSNSGDDSNVAVADSFPGRMNWDTQEPQGEPPRRLDRALRRQQQVRGSGERLGGVHEEVRRRAGADLELLIGPTRSVVRMPLPRSW